MGKLGCWAGKTLSLFAGSRVIVERALSFLLEETLAQNITSTRYITYCPASGKMGRIAEIKGVGI